MTPLLLALHLTMAQCSQVAAYARQVAIVSADQPQESIQIPEDVADEYRGVMSQIVQYVYRFRGLDPDQVFRDVRQVCDFSRGTQVVPQGEI